MPETLDAKARLLNAALDVFRTKGYAASRVEDICEAAGLTKGGFFHHFPGKEEIAIEAAAHWSAVTGTFFETASYHKHADPLDRLLGYVDFRRSLLRGALPQFTCYAGTVIQETFATHPSLSEACGRSITSHAAEVAKDIAAAKRIYAPKARWSSGSLALHMQAVIQGAFVLAKAEGGPQVADACILHLRRYLELLFGRSNQTKTQSK